MGINTRLEDERGRLVEEIVDASGYMNWLLSLAAEDDCSCARAIDPYGQTVFNRLQVEQLKSELERLKGHITDNALAASKREYLAHLGDVPANVMDEAVRNVEQISTRDLIGHLAKLLALISVAEAIGPHHYVRFVGD